MVHVAWYFCVLIYDTALAHDCARKHGYTTPKIQLYKTIVVHVAWYLCVLIYDTALAHACAGPFTNVHGYTSPRRIQLYKTTVVHVAWYMCVLIYDTALAHACAGTHDYTALKRFNSTRQYRIVLPCTCVC